jgi:hypothetical protein
MCEHGSLFAERAETCHFIVGCTRLPMKSLNLLSGVVGGSDELEDVKWWGANDLKKEGNRWVEERM